jgi:hypothetical protein
MKLAFLMFLMLFWVRRRFLFAVVEVALDDLLDDRPEIPVLFLEAPLVFAQESLEMMEDNPVENRAFRMSKAIDFRHI